MDEPKPALEPPNEICRCCLTTDRPMKNALPLASYFMDLTGINVTLADGMPQWLCVECCSLLQKAVRFKHKVLRAQTLLYDYIARCAPFPVDAQDEELKSYSSPPLRPSSMLVFETGRGRMGFQKVLEHDKQVQKTELDVMELPAVSKDEDVKEEVSFSDYEDNITLEEYRSNAKLTEDLFTDEEPGSKETKKRKGRKKESKEKKKKSSPTIKEEEADVKPEPKASIRKAVELDPTKIRIVTLNPEEQIRSLEEESKVNFKFPFQCTLCFKGFNFEAKLQNHMHKHSPSRGPFECKICSMYLPTSYSFSVHSLIHTRRYECLKCGRMMIDKSSIIDHYRSQHEGILTLFTCNICGKVSNNNKTHRGHIRNHHSGDRAKCELCGKSFVNKDSLSEHLQIHQGIKNYECSECGMRFRTRTQIKHHQLKHTDVKDFYCVECDVRFKSSHSLRQHLMKSLKHKDKQSFTHPCSRCSKRFDSSRRLMRHLWIQHEGARPHSCSECGAALASRASLNKHIASVHNGVRPPASHVCDTCGKAFRGKSVLINHVRTHTGEKPFSCLHCGRTFTQRTAMRTHVKLVHLKIRRTAKIKPEVLSELSEAKLDPVPKEDPVPKLDHVPKTDNMFPKTENLVFEAWNRQNMNCDEVFFTVTAGP